MRYDETYRDLVRDILNNGDPRTDRTEIGCTSLFNRSYSVNLEHEFPLLTLREINWQTVVHELIWFLSGDESIDYLVENGVKIWNPWADDANRIRKGYGYQWRKWGDDQIARLIHGLRENPASRRHVVSAWNAGDLDDMSLPPCHMFFQCFVRNVPNLEPRLDLMMYQRSCDVIIGLPFNTAEYALLTHLIAAACGYRAGVFSHVIGDAHIYHNLYAEAHELVARTPSLAPPSFKLNRSIRPSDIVRPNLDSTDFSLTGYFPQAKMDLRNKVAV